MTEAPPKSSRKTSGGRVRDVRTFQKFLEELSWVLSTYSNIDFKALPQIFRQMEMQRNLSVHQRGIDEYVPDNPNIHFLVGVLPKAFSDSQLFKTNEDMVDFAHDAMNLQIPRWQKKSREELIGQIVCAAYQLDDRKLSNLVRALGKLTRGDKVVKDKVSQQRDQKLRWNAIIQELTRENA